MSPTSTARACLPSATTNRKRWRTHRYCLLPMVGLAFLTIVLPTTSVLALSASLLASCIRTPAESWPGPAPPCVSRVRRVMLRWRRNIFSYLLTFGVICWCALTSASIFEAALRMEHQKWLVAYPLFLCYSAFALITIF